MELIGILLSLSFLVLMSFKRVNIVVGTIVSSFIVIFTNKMDIEIAFFGETNLYSRNKRVCRELYNSFSVKFYTIKLFFRIRCI